jgi:hypothetical protein
MKSNTRPATPLRIGRFFEKLGPRILPSASYYNNGDKMLALTYVSIAKRAMTKEELKAPLTDSASRNRGLKITGMLVHKEGKFLQILEGPDDIVRELFATIAKDSRHEAIIKLSEEIITERKFSYWTMGFRNLEEMRDDGFPGFSGFLSEEPIGQIFPLDPDQANKLLTVLR